MSYIAGTISILGMDPINLTLLMVDMLGIVGMVVIVPMVGMVDVVGMVGMVGIEVIAGKRDLVNIFYLLFI